MGKGSKMTVCKTCGNEIAASAKACPNCGGKNKKPIFKRPWFIVLCVIVVIGVIAAAGGSNDEKPKNDEVKTEQGQEKEQEQEKEYIAYDVAELMDDLRTNALKASDKYKGQYVSLTGELSTIDSSGSYISLIPANDNFAIIGVTCDIKNDEQLDKIKNMEKGDIITVKGKIKSVGEVLGYSLDIDVVE